MGASHLEPDFDLRHLYPNPLHPLSDLGHQSKVVLLLGLHGMVHKQRPVLAVLFLNNVRDMDDGCL